MVLFMFWVHVCMHTACSAHPLLLLALTFVSHSVAWQPAPLFSRSRFDLEYGLCGASLLLLLRTSFALVYIRHTSWVWNANIHPLCRHEKKLQSLIFPPFFFFSFHFFCSSCLHANIFKSILLSPPQSHSSMSHGALVSIFFASWSWVLEICKGDGCGHLVHSSASVGHRRVGDGCFWVCTARTGPGESVNWTGQRITLYCHIAFSNMMLPCVASSIMLYQSVFLCACVLHYLVHWAALTWFAICVCYGCVCICVCVSLPASANLYSN